MLDTSQWCSSSHSMCTADSITGILSLLFCILFTYRLWNIYPMTPAEHTESKWLFAFLLILSLECILTMFEGIYHNNNNSNDTSSNSHHDNSNDDSMYSLSASFIFKLTFELLFWILAAVLMYLEAYRLLNWPWNMLPLSVFIINFPDLAYSFFTIQNNESASVALYGIWSVKIALSLIVVLMYSIKTYYDANEDAYDIHLRDRSEDFYSNSPIKKDSVNHNYHQNNNNRSVSNGGLSRWLTWGSQSSLGHPATTVGPESAINRNIHDDHNRSQRNTHSNSFLGGAFSWLTGTTNSSNNPSTHDQDATRRLLEDEEMQKMQPYEDHRYSSMSSANSFSSNGSMGSSRALMQVMEQHRAKVTASNPILEPKGVDYYDYSTSTAKKASDSNGNDNELRFQVLVQKWGLRNKKITATTENTKEKRSDESDGPSLETNESKTEIEFEIVVASRSGGIDRQQVDWNKANSQQQKTAASITRWTVWRSVDEITKLHSQMVNLMGDLIPRRPRLNSSGGNANSLSYAELVSDMKAIAIYLNALLRSKQFIRKPLEDFLELDRAKINTSTQEGKETASEKVVPAGATKESGLQIDDPPKESVLEDWEKNVLGRQGSEPNSPNNPNGAAVGNVPPAGVQMTMSQKQQSNTSAKQATSLMDAAERNADQNAARQEKWRKLFTRMKIKLKPSEVGIRCRLFEGVLSGGDITAWLMRSATADTPGEVDRHANIDRNEACSIGQELLDCGLLEAVCAGFKDEESESYEDNDGMEASDHPDLFFGFGEKLFSDMPGFVYRFPGKSGTAGCWTLFGAPIYVKIPTMTVVEDTDMRSTRDTTTISLFEPGGGDGDGGEAGTGSTANTHVKYVIDITHGGDIWQITRRYREFENLQKTLAKEGIRAEVPLPPKSFMMSAISRTKKQLNESRRIGLEQYLSSLLQAVIDNGSDKDKLILAKFLDDEYYNLRVLGDHKNEEL